MAHLLFLFFVVVILCSLLIVQMQNHTYSNIQQHADILLISSRARSIRVIQKAIAGLPGIVKKNSLLSVSPITFIGVGRGALFVIFVTQ